MKPIAKRLLVAVLSLVLVLGIVAPLTAAQAQALTYNGSSSYESGKYYTALTNVKLTGNQRKDIVNVAKSQVGYQEGGSSSQLSGTVRGNGNCTEYGRWYGLQDMWCAMFVSWCADQAGVSTSIVPSHAFTPSGLNWFRDRGLAYSRATVAAGKYTPKAGDIIYFKSGRNENICNHVGIVTGYSDGTVYTVEGNTSSATVSTNGGAVAAKSYDISNTYIVYICSPNYKNTESTQETEFYAKIGNANVGKNLALNGDDVIVEKNSSDDDQIWRFQLQSDGYYKITNTKTAKVLEVVGGGSANGTEIQMADSNNSAAQRWKLEKITGGYALRPKCAATTALDVGATSLNVKLWKYSGKAVQTLTITKVTTYLANPGSNFYGKITLPSSELNLSLSGTEVITYSNSAKPAQTWHFERMSYGAYKITNTKTGQVLEVEGTVKEGANVRIADSDNGKNQRWYIYSVNGKLILKSVSDKNFVLDVAGSTTSTMVGLQVSAYKGGSDQQFAITKVSTHVVDLGTNFYAKLENITGGLNLSLSGTDVITYGDSDKPAQVWKFVRQSDASYKIVNTKTSQVLTVSGDSVSGAKVHIAGDTGASDQRWLVYIYNGNYILRPMSNVMLALDISGDATQTLCNARLGAYTGKGDQRFAIKKVDTHVVNLGSNFYAKLESVTGGLNLSLAGTDVITYGDSDKPAQVWNFIRQSDASYKIVNTKTGQVLTVNGESKNGVKVHIANDTGASSQRWLVYTYSGNYILRPMSDVTMALDISGDATQTLCKAQLWAYHGNGDQRFAIRKVELSASGTATKAQMAVIRKIIYAVETGGQVYGKQDYTDFTEAYTNSSEEHAITIGAGQWYATEAKTLLNNIRKADPALFAKLDTAGIASDLDNKDWSTYKLSAGSAKAKCIQAIIGSSVGIACQDALIEEQMAAYMAEAAALGVKDLDAQMMCANIRHQGGLGAMKRILGKTTGGYTLDNIYAAMQTDTGNQVGVYKSRQKMVYNALKEHIS